MEIVYNGYDNIVSVRVSELVLGVKTNVDLSAVTSIKLELPEIPQTVVSGIDWSAGDGIIRFDLGSMGLSAGLYSARLVAVDLAHPLGQVLVHESTGALRFKVI